VVQRTLIRPPSSQLGAITDEERRAVMNRSPVNGIYEKAVDRNSAFEILAVRAKRAAEEAREAEETEAKLAAEERARKQTRRYDGGSSTTRTRSSRSDSVTMAFTKSLARSLGSKAGQQLIRGILGSLTKLR
jgi:DNA helicase HerA-like ATPase